MLLRAFAGSFCHAPPEFKKVLFGKGSTAGQLVRRTVAVGVLFGVLVTPLEASLPDVHEVNPGPVAATMVPAHVGASPATQLVNVAAAGARESTVVPGTMPSPKVAESASLVSHMESQHVCNPGTNPDGCPQDQSSTTGYDHCAHSHVAHLAREDARSFASAVKYATYTQPKRLPASFRASPAIRPPIA